MAPKRPLEDGKSSQDAKKPRKGFSVGPENLPDGPWRRKITKIKKGLVDKAKVKKQYAKVKAQESSQSKRKPQVDAAEDDPSNADEKEDHHAKDKDIAEEDALHPTRQLMLKDEFVAQANSSADAASGTNASADASDGHRRRTRRPGYYDKQLKKADERRAENEARQQEFQRRREEREQKIAERQRYKKRMAKTIGADGKKKLGRESEILLDKVRKMVAE